MYLHIAWIERGGPLQHRQRQINAFHRHQKRPEIGHDRRGIRRQFKAATEQCGGLGQMALHPPCLGQVVVQVGVGWRMLQRVGVAGGGFAEVVTLAGEVAQMVVYFRIVTASRQGITEVRFRRDKVA
jgi:hypothetical protein